MPRRVCSVRDDEGAYIPSAPYEELKMPDFPYYVPGRTVADDCPRYRHGLPKVLSMEEAQAEDASRASVKDVE